MQKSERGCEVNTLEFGNKICTILSTIPPGKSLDLAYLSDVPLETINSDLSPSNDTGLPMLVHPVATNATLWPVNYSPRILGVRTENR